MTVHDRGRSLADGSVPAAAPAAGRPAPGIRGRGRLARAGRQRPATGRRRAVPAASALLRGRSTGLPRQVLGRSGGGAPRSAAGAAVGDGAERWPARRREPWSRVTGAPASGGRRMGRRRLVGAGSDGDGTGNMRVEALGGGAATVAVGSRCGWPRRRRHRGRRSGRLRLRLSGAGRRRRPRGRPRRRFRHRAPAVGRGAGCPGRTGKSGVSSVGCRNPCGQDQYRSERCCCRAAPKSPMETSQRTKVIGLLNDHSHRP